MRRPVFDRRRAGVLLHLGSLEGALGRGGRAFIDWIAAAGFSLWQILPVGPTGHDGSPYWVRSDFAGHYDFVDTTELPDARSPEHASFLESARSWLPDYALFEALSLVHAGPWWSWPTPLRDRAPQAMAHAASELAPQIELIQTQQFAFAMQWARLREHAESRGVRLLGDLPFYVAPDSAEVWVHRHQFQLAPDGRPAAVAGVPPDYFSQTGQLWGNPLYDWPAIRADGFALWRARILQQLQRVDVLRIDHFRALAAHWAVPASAADARGGSWCPTPGEQLLESLQGELGELPIVAEDLGLITEDVEALRRKFHLPGMRVLQFAFGGPADNPHLPYMHERDSIVYTGTHDNDTTMGWFAALDAQTRAHVEFFLRLTPGAMPEALVRAALGSVGRLAVIPAQDLLQLGTEARLNTPGTAQGNWSWRLPPGCLTNALAATSRGLNEIYGRI